VKSDDSFRSFSYKSIDCRATQTFRQSNNWNIKRDFYRLK
jgi:hypothetical protein